MKYAILFSLLLCKQDQVVKLFNVHRYNLAQLNTWLNFDNAVQAVILYILYSFLRLKQKFTNLMSFFLFLTKYAANLTMT